MNGWVAVKLNRERKEGSSVDLKTNEQPDIEEVTTWISGGWKGLTEPIACSP